MLIKDICTGIIATTFSLVSANAAITFTVSFTPQALGNLSSAEQAMFTNGLQFWDNYIDGYRDGQSRSWNLSVDTFSTPADGMGLITLGSAGPDGVILSNPVPGSGLGGSWPDRFILSNNGDANFNTHADAGALQASTIRHEIGHALGIGTLWEDNEVYSDGVVNPNREGSGAPGQYTGGAALAAYQAEFDPGATFVPVEMNGSLGTANIHWNEADSPLYGDAGSAILAISGPGAGLSMDDELMSGSSSGPSWISDTTIASLYDIGFTLAPMPEPGSIALLGVGLLISFRRRR